jgi:hypothetical protein
MSGNADGSSVDENEGEWGIIIEKKRSLWQRLSGEGRIAPNDEMVGLLEEILSGDTQTFGMCTARSRSSHASRFSPERDDALAVTRRRAIS